VNYSHRSPRKGKPATCGAFLNPRTAQRRSQKPKEASSFENCVPPAPVPAALGHNQAIGRDLAPSTVSPDSG